MGLRLKTNMDSLVAQRNLEENSNHLQNNMEKLSSGLRINKAMDDPAGLAISEHMETKIRSLAQAKRNASDGVSYLQIGESSLSELSDIVVRMRELSIQSASDTISEQDRSYLSKEFEQLGSELNRIKNTTEFNGKKLFENDDDFKIQIGIHSSSSLKDSDPEDNVLNFKYTNMRNFNDAISALSESNIKGKNASDIGGRSPEKILQTIDTAFNEINNLRTNYGAIQTRLNSTISNIDVTSENFSAANSKIRDLDYALETSQYAQNKILVLGGTSILTQANQLPERTLALIRQ